MAIRPVLRLGDPRLLERSTPVDQFDHPELDSLIDDMFDTMAAEDGAGLAAPQIGIPLRVVIFGVEHNPRYPDAGSVPRTVLINPVITPISADMDEAWEGCLSVPHMRGLVRRHRHIRYTGFDRTGESIDITASGFHARVVQHECDHLDGILYTHRLHDQTRFGFTEELLESGQLDKRNCDG